MASLQTLADSPLLLLNVDMNCRGGQRLPLFEIRGSCQRELTDEVNTFIAILFEY